MLPDPRPYFADLPDPRRETRNKLHPLPDIVMIVLCAVLSGIEDWVGMEDFANEKETWLRGFLALPQGSPSPDTLSDVRGRLQPQAFTDAFQRWVQAALPSLFGEQVCLDGKTRCGSREAERAVHLMSAFATQARWVLAQQAVPDKANEITAIPDLWAMLELNGAGVSIDAMGCQKTMAHQIVEAGADSVLSLKDHHPTLHEAVRVYLDAEIAKRRLPVYETVEKDHGRIESRRYAVGEALDWLPQKPEWAGLSAVGRVESIRQIGDKSTTECRYYLCSFTDLPRFAQTVRGHGGIENREHWVRDVQFGEDANRTRKHHSAANLGRVRRVARNLLRRHPTDQDSLRRRQRRACLNDDYRACLLFGTSATT